MPLKLMPTPVIYEGAAVDPFAHLDSSHRTNEVNVFYATNRTSRSSDRFPQYGNQLDRNMKLGRARISIGDSQTDWPELVDVSLGNSTISPPPLILESVEEAGAIPVEPTDEPFELDDRTREFIDGINEELARAVDKEIMIYVHGAKVDFYNAVALTAEIDHFAGRDFVGVAFDWPSHQNILSYVVRTDVHHALDSSGALRRLIHLLSEHTTAEHINVLSYSAGGRVTSKALLELRESSPVLKDKKLKNRFRLGSVIFASADVAVDDFLNRIEAVSELANQVVIILSDDDNVLRSGQMFMGGPVRAGMAEAEKIEEEFIVEHKLANTEIIDVSRGQEVRGFDITGHHYWYHHPWSSSDVIFLLRTDLPAHERGLTSAEIEGIWYLAPDYPENVRGAARRVLQGQWESGH